jgi:hypothetical protein
MAASKLRLRLFAVACANPRCGRCGIEQMAESGNRSNPGMRNANGGPYPDLSISCIFFSEFFLPEICFVFLEFEFHINDFENSEISRFTRIGFTLLKKR